MYKLLRQLSHVAYIFSYLTEIVQILLDMTHYTFIMCVYQEDVCMDVCMHTYVRVYACMYACLWGYAMWYAICKCNKRT